MTAEQLVELRDRLLLRIPLCPEGYASACVRLAATQFFKDSEVWRYNIKGIPVTAGESTYELALPDAGVDVHRLDYVLWLGALVPSEQYSLDYLDRGTAPVEDWKYCLVFGADYIPTESIDDCLDVTLVLAPSEISGYVDPRLWRQWSNGILAGARIAAYTSQLRPWFDPMAAASASSDYADELAKARMERTQQYGADGDLRAINPEGWIL